MRQITPTLSYADRAVIRPRVSKVAIVSLILSAYTVVGTIVVLGAGSWLFYGEEPVAIGVILSLPLTFFSSTLLAILAKSTRPNSRLSTWALIAMVATVSAMVALLMAGISYLPRC